METPVLTHSERSKAFSSNKSKRKKKSTNIRNVLGNFKSRSSIKISEINSTLLEQKLKIFFDFTPPTKPKWSKIKNMSKEMRKQAHKNLKQPRPVLFDNFVCGINAVTRALENKLCMAILIANDINPLLMVHHIFEACSINDIPLLEIPNLRAISKSCFGFPCIVMGIKNMIKTNPMYSIIDFFISISPNVSQMLKNKTCATKDTNKNLSEIIELEEEEIHIEEEMDVEEKIDTNKQNKATNFYLYKNAGDAQRIFIPPKSSKKITTIPQSLDFIALMNDDDDEAMVPLNKTYKNLKIKRLKPNPNRQKGKKKL